ncbi:MAG: gamma carbonic anhydrase family protein [Acidobacteria bacterium]|nr:gamma carbonic anhydrase family protein [Acidobacteriota bacterium]
MILSYKGVLPRIAESAFVAENADVIGDVEVGDESSVWFQTVLRADVSPIRVGTQSNIQDGSILHGTAGLPTILGNWVTVGHRVILHACRIEDHCLIGMGAIILNRVHVGEGSIVAAGALVPERTVIPPGSLYAGVPARLQRKLIEADRKFIDSHASHYLEYKDAYMAGTRREPAS